MRLGLARHFQIPHKKFAWMNGNAFSDWSQWYDVTDVNARDVPKAGSEWDACYSSDLPRAIFTAHWLYQGPIQQSALLREVPYANFLPRNMKFPLFMWQASSRVGWFLDLKRQAENRGQTLKRIEEFLAFLLSRHGSNESILIVSHGFYMQFLEKELVRRGFSGKVPMRPRGGIIYPFEK